jgi:hypothetical protein
VKISSPGRLKRRDVIARPYFLSGMIERTVVAPQNASTVTQLPSIDLLKIDAEQDEIAVLNGAAGLISLGARGQGIARGD